MRLIISAFVALVWCVQAQAQQIILPCVPSGPSCIPVSAANPLPTTGNTVTSVTIGTTTLTSGTDTRVLFQDGASPSGVLQEDAGLTYNKSTGALNSAIISGGTAAGSTLTLQSTSNGSPSGDSVSIKAGGSTIATFNSVNGLLMGGFNIIQIGSLASNSVGGYELITGTASSTVPTLIPNKADTTSGIGAQASGNVSIIASGTEMMRLTSSLITIPTVGTDSGQTATATVCEDTTSHALYFGSGTGGICKGTSSAQFKQNIRPVSELGLANIVALNPKKYRYRKGIGQDTSHEQIGLIAEDVMQVLPDCASDTSVDYLCVAVVSINAIKQLKAELDDYKRSYP